MIPRTFRGRIQAALALATALPLAIGVLLAWLMLDAALREDPGETVSRALAAGVEAHRALFRARREADELRADRIAGLLATADPRPGRLEAILDEACAQDPDLRALRVVRPGQTPRRVDCPSRPGRAEREMALTRPLPDEGRLDLTFALQETAYEGLTTTAAALERVGAPGGRRRRLAAYWAAFGLLFGLGVMAALGVAGGLAHRTTRRIGALTSATRRIRAGEAEVTVPVEGEDELAALATDFNAMVHELQERERRIAYLEKISSWQEIARRLAHEIKNPLTPIQLSVQQLVRGYRGDDERFRRLLQEVDDIVGEEVGVLRRLVTEFSEFAKLPTAEPEPTDLAAWVRSFVRGHPDLSQDAAMDLSAPEAPVGALVDRALMRRVLANLIQNAIQAAEEAGLVPKVHLLVRDGPGGPSLSVADEGPGLSPEVAVRVFDPYFTTKETGTGLGLAICKKIVLQHGGRIELDTAPDHGARFEIHLPPAPSDARLAELTDAD